MKRGKESFNEYVDRMSKPGVNLTKDIGDFLKDWSEDESRPEIVLSFDDIESHMKNVGCCYEALDMAKEAYNSYAEMDMALYEDARRKLEEELEPKQ